MSLLLIFDTHSGLCNQFYDIENAIYFCLKYNIQFTFRYCSFRNDNLCSWTKQPFEKLFDLKPFEEYKLYIDYYKIKDDVNEQNCFNFNGDIRAHQLYPRGPNTLSTEILDNIISLNKKYVVLVQFWAVYAFRDRTKISKPVAAKNLVSIYVDLEKKIINNEPYNFIHYRYESDFTNFFNIKVDPLGVLIDRLVFKNNDLKIYVATSNIKYLPDFNRDIYKNILCKDDYLSEKLNFEELAFIDYMFGINSQECYGHNRSSFSTTINSIKGTNNFYAW